MPSVTRPSGGGARAARRERLEAQVLAAVERLLADGESFTTLGIQRIADEVGMGRTTFYGHFPDKATLLMRLTETATGRLFETATAVIEDDESTLEQIEEAVLSHIREYRAHAPLLRAMNEVAAYDPQVAAAWRAKIEGAAARMRLRLERDQRAGRMPTSLDPAVVATWIAWGTERLVSAHVDTSSPHADRAFAAGVAGATWASMGRPLTTDGGASTQPD